VEDLAEMMVAVLDDLPPYHLNKNKDVDSSSPLEEDPAPKTIKQNKGKFEKPERKKNRKEEMAETRPHHVRTSCRMPRCESVVCEIRRHLMVHVKWGELDANDVDGYVEVMRHGKRKHLVSKGNPEVRGSTKRKQKERRKKWCSVPDCTTVCVRFDEHLTRKHKIKLGSVPYRVYLREAKPYQGRLELDKVPHTVPAAEDQPSTSLPAPRPTEEPQAAPCEDDSFI